MFGRTLHDNDVLAPQYRVLVPGAPHGAFAELGDATDTVDAMVVGLPAYAFSRPKDHLREQMLKPFVVPLPAPLRGRFGAELRRPEIENSHTLILPQESGYCILALCGLAAALYAVDPANSQDLRNHLGHW